MESIWQNVGIMFGFLIIVADKMNNYLKERHKTADILYIIGGLIFCNLLRQQGKTFY